MSEDKKNSTIEEALAASIAAAVNPKSNSKAEEQASSAAPAAKNFSSVVLEDPPASKSTHTEPPVQPVNTATKSRKKSEKSNKQAVSTESEPSFLAADEYIKFSDVRKVYKMGEVEISALAGVNFSVKKGEICIVVGPSGAGKSTILNLLGGMDRASFGNMLVAGEDISKYGERRLVAYRRNDVGFIFQFYNLVQNLTALENVELATQIAKDPFNPKQILDDVGLSDRSLNFPAQLSGGEQQRVAIARALAKNPKLLLCDEPTGALDYNTGKKILKLLQDTALEKGMTVVIVTHNLALSDIGNRVIRLKNGLVESITVNEHPADVMEVEW